MGRNVQRDECVEGGKTCYEGYVWTSEGDHRVFLKEIIVLTCNPIVFEAEFIIAPRRECRRGNSLELGRGEGGGEGEEEEEEEDSPFSEVYV
jgi:hypothetical protein